MDGIAPDIAEFFESTWASRPSRRSRRRSSSGWWRRSSLIYGFYRLALRGAQRRAATFGAASWRNAFVHSLVPIAFA